MNFSLPFRRRMLGHNHWRKIKSSSSELCLTTWRVAGFATHDPNNRSSSSWQTTPRKSSLNPPLNASGHSFKVLKLSYGKGDIESFNMTTTQLLKKASILPRDLFTLNITSRQERRMKLRPERYVSAIVPKETVILLSFGSIRAVVGLDHVFLFDAHKPMVRAFAKEVAAVFRSGNLHGEPPELVFLEQVLNSTVESFNRRLRLYEPIVDSFLDKVSNEIYSDTGVHQLVPLKDSLQSFEIQVKQSIDCLTGLLNQDDEMLDLLLTEQEEARFQGLTVEHTRHEHVELLLGVYARELDNISAEISYALGRLQSKQEFVALSLAGYRNRMIRMNVHIGIAGLTFGFGTTFAGFFGMNLVNGLESSPIAFDYVVLSALGGGGLIAVGALNYLSGTAMQKRASQRLEEIETLTSALSDLGAIDYSIKSSLRQGLSVDRQTFRKMLEKARPNKEVTEAEVDLIFNVFDRAEDGHIDEHDIPSRPNSLPP